MPQLLLLINKLGAECDGKVGAKVVTGTRLQTRSNQQSRAWFVVAVAVGVWDG